MLGNLKVNNSDSVSTIMSLKQGDDHSGIKSGSADFYSMVMNNNREMDVKTIIDNASPNETVSKNSFSDLTGQIDRKTESKPENNERIPADYSAEKGDTSVKSAVNGEKSVNKNETPAVEKEKKAETKRDGEKEIIDFLNSSAGEMLIKKITELAKGTARSNTEDFLKKFSRLAEELLSPSKKKTPAVNGLNFLNTGEMKGAQAVKSPILTDFFDKLGRELLKLTAGKKGNDKVPVFSEKELKETIGAIIDDIKKGKTRNHDRSEIRRAEHDEVRNDRKNELPGEQLVLKKKENGSDSGFDLNAGKEKNGNRDGGSFANAKADAISRNNFEKNEQVMKSPEFRQSLQEIIDKAKISVRDSNNATFSVRLFPKDLGSVNVNLLMENGIVSGRFLVDSDEAKHLLMNNLGELREQLAEAGIQVGEFNVNVNQGGERFASKEKEDENAKTLNPVNRESEAAMNKYDYNSSAAHNGHINMVI